MPNQQYNLYNQTPQSTQPAGQPAPEPPSNKLWPINWIHNKFSKILFTAWSLSFFFHIASVFATILINLIRHREPQSQPNPLEPICLGCPPPTYSLIFINILLASFILFITLSVIYLIYLLIRFKKLKKSNKILFFIIIAFIICVILFYRIAFFQDFSEFFNLIIKFIKIFPVSSHNLRKL